MLQLSKAGIENLSPSNLIFRSEKIPFVVLAQDISYQVLCIQSFNLYSYFSIFRPAKKNMPGLPPCVFRSYQISVQIDYGLTRLSALNQFLIEKILAQTDRCSAPRSRILCRFGLKCRLDNTNGGRYFNSSRLQTDSRHI